MLRNSYQSLKFSGILCVALGMSAALAQTTIAHELLDSEVTEIREAELKARAEHAQMEEKNRLLMKKHQLLTEKHRPALVKYAELGARYRAAVSALERARTQAKNGTFPTEANASNAKKSAAMQNLVAACQTLRAALHNAHLEIDELNKQIHGIPEEISIQTYQLKHIDGGYAAHTLSHMFDSQSTRIALAENSSTLIIRSTEDMFKEISNVLAAIDQPTKQDQEGQQDSSNIPESVMLRIFLVADSDTGDHESNDIPDARRILPGSVTDALYDTLAFRKGPCILLQSNISIALDENHAGDFAIEDMPKSFNGKPFTFDAQGSFRIDNSNRVRLHMEASTNSQTGKDGSGHNGSHFTGSMTAPLGHYLVLGTTNLDVGSEVNRLAYVVQIVEAKSFAPEEK